MCVFCTFERRVGVQVAGRVRRYLLPIFLQMSRKSHILTDLVTFVCIVVFVLRLKANHGQTRMNRLLRTILQDGVLYFFIMAGFHIAMVLFAFFARVATFLSLPRKIDSDVTPSQSSIQVFPLAAVVVCVLFPSRSSFVTNVDPSDSLIPVMISRLVISLRKAVNTSLVQAWDGDHFTAVESGGDEISSFSNPPSYPMSFTRPLVVSSHSIGT